MSLQLRRMFPKMPLGLVGCLCLLLSGCSVTAMMAPVEGPLSQLRPVPVFKVRADGITGNSGKISFAMPDGEV